MPALFFHVTQSVVEEVLQTNLLRALERGWRVEIRGQDAARMGWLDEKLWLGPEEGFLPHGLAVDGPQDALQPVLLTLSPRPQGRQAIMVLDGAEVSAAEVAGAERVWIFFDGRNEAAVERARAQWTALTGAGASAQYWSEQDGRWALKAERPAG